MKKLFIGFLLSFATYAGIAQCSGTLTLTAGSGTITDGPGSYSNNQNCSWLIQPTSGGVITLDFTSFDLESNYDYLTIYEGTNSYGSYLRRYTGSSLPSSLTSSSSSLFVRFTTDGSATRSGFELNYSSCTFPKPTITSSSTTYCNSDILFFDEPTSSLDSKTSDNFLEVVHSFHNNKTMFMVSHKIENLKKCDKILLIENSTVIVK